MSRRPSRVNDRLQPLANKLSCFAARVWSLMTKPLFLFPTLAPILTIEPLFFHFILTDWKTFDTLIAVKDLFNGYAAHFPFTLFRAT
jgi:hypothetical protein